MAESDLSTSTHIGVHTHSRSPNKAWKILQKTHKFKKLKVENPKDPKKEGFIRFVCVSDTHSRTDKMPPVPPGDILLHAGDFTSHSSPEEFLKFNTWLGTLPHTHKIVIAGNHELALDPEDNSKLRALMKLSGRRVPVHKKDYVAMLTNCTYLEDEKTNVLGFSIYGSPWQPLYHSGAFTLIRGADLLEKWEKIPEDTDILLTHTPPLGYGDESTDCGHAGDVELLTSVQQRIRPQYHVFGHIHEGYGLYTDGVTNYINASICTRHYKPNNQPIVFDLPDLSLKAGDADGSSRHRTQTKHVPFVKYLRK